MPNTERLKDLMQIQQITQERLAKMIGISQSSLCQKLNNHRPMLLEEAERIAQVLQIPDAVFAAYFFED